MHSKPLYYLAVAVLTAGAGCAGRTALEVPEIHPDGNAYVSEGQFTADSAFVEQGRWWEAFGDEQLNALVDTLFVRNIQIDQAGARVTEFQALYHVTGAARFPTVNVAGAAQRSRSHTLYGLATGNLFSLSAAAQYELDLWGKIHNRSKASFLRAMASREDLHALYLSIAAQFIDNYFLAVELRSQLELLEQTIASDRDFLEIVELRYRQGVSPALDVYQARQQLSGSLALLPQIESSLRDVEFGLRIFLGQYPERMQTDAPSALPEIVPVIGVGLPSELLLRRPDIRASLLHLQAADAELAAAVRDQYPSLSLTASAGGSSRDLEDLLDPGSRVWTLLGNLVQPLFDGGRRRAQADYQDAVRMEQIALYKADLLQAFREVESALDEELQVRNRIRYQEEQVTATRNALRNATERYQQGLISYLPVLTAQQGLYQSERNLISARRLLVSSRVALARSLGGGWETSLVNARLAHN